MSIVAVHGPHTFGSKAVVSNATGTAMARPNPANGLIWTLEPKDKSQVAANYDWSWTPTSPAASPVSPVLNTMMPTITFPDARTWTVTLTLAGVAQATFTITTVAGAAPLMLMGGEEGGEEPPPEEDGAYDPGDYTVTEVIGHVEDNPDELEAVIAAEEAGKARVTLLSHLEGMREV